VKKIRVETIATCLEKLSAGIAKKLAASEAGCPLFP
jgi:hypothetical protein